MRLISCQGDHRAAKALITASLRGLPLPAGAPGQEVQGAGLVDTQMSPLGNVPVMQLDCGTCLFGSNAIARFLARLPSHGGGATLYGSTPEEAVRDNPAQACRVASIGLHAVAPSVTPT